MKNQKSIQRRFTQSGSTIIEVLIASVIVGMVMTAVAAMMTLSVKNTAELRYRSVATTQAQSGLEVFRRERETLGWDTFYDSLDDGVYCLNTLPSNSTAFIALSPGICDDTLQLLGTDFVRQATVVRTVNGDGTEQVRIDMLMDWVDKGDKAQVSLTQIFKKIE